MNAFGVDPHKLIQITNILLKKREEEMRIHFTAINIKQWFSKC